MTRSAEPSAQPPAPREGVEVPAPPEPPPVEDAPGALTLEGMSVNPDPDEVAAGRELDAAHTDHDDVSGTRPGVTPAQPPLTPARSARRNEGQSIHARVPGTRRVLARSEDAS